MNQLRYTLTAGALALTLMGAGCSTTTNTNTTATTNTNSTNTNTVANDNTNVNAAGGTFLENSNSSNLNDTPDSTEDTESTDSEPVVNATKTFDVVASQYAFTPETLTVNAGDTVVINLSTDDVPHGFSIPDFGVNATITPGKTKAVEFVADAAGSYTFSCSVACGSGHNSMRGTLVVN